MKVKDLIKELKTCNQDAVILVSNDEELNTLFKRFEVADIASLDGKRYVIYGLTGSEVE